MGDYIALIDIIPEEMDVDFDELVEKLKSVLPETSKIEHFDILPVAFGLEKVRLRVRYPEQWGGTDRLEELFSKVKGIQGIEALAFSKA